MTARSIDKRTDNILIGAGEVYLDIHEGGAATGERYLGDAVGAELEVAAEETTVFSGSGPVARELTRIARSVTRTARLTLHDISLENLALFTVGDVKRLGAAGHVSGEAAILRPGRWYQLGGADRPAGVLRLATPASKAAAIAAVTVATTAQSPVTATQAIEANRFATGNAEAEQKGPVHRGLCPRPHLLVARRPRALRRQGRHRGGAPLSPSTTRQTTRRGTRCRARSGS